MAATEESTSTLAEEASHEPSDDKTENILEACRHWLRGFCFYGDKCRAAHPPERLGEQRGARMTRSNGRLKVRNNSKTLIFRRFLLETFGREYLRSGSGIIDVAGGKGQLSFELLNLNLIPSTVWDPRELDVAEYEKRLRLGMYHRNEIWAPWLHSEDPSKSKDPKVYQPGHVRMFFDEVLVRALAPQDRTLPKELLPPSRATKRQRLNSGQVNTESQPDTGANEMHEHKEEGTPDQKFAELYAKTAGVVNQIRWSKKGLIFDKNNVSLATVKDKHNHYVCIEGAASAASITNDTLLTLLDSSASTAASSPPSSASASSSASSSSTSSDCQSEVSSSGDSKDTEQSQTEVETSYKQPWYEVRDTLLNASVVVGLHPDQACGAIVDFALLHNKPFVVLPCCVYWKQFGRRHLPGTPPRQVKSYDDLCQWIMNKHPRVKRIEMPFEGKNVLLYWIPDGLEFPDAFEACPLPGEEDQDDREESEE